MKSRFKTFLRYSNQVIILRLIFLFCPLMLQTGLHALNDMSDAETKLDKLHYLMTAKSGSSNENTLTLTDVPLVISFSKSPKDIGNHLSLDAFFQNWRAECAAGMSKSATLTILGPQGATKMNATLLNLEIKNGAMIFTITPQKEKIPETFGLASLFIYYWKRIN